MKKCIRFLAIIMVCVISLATLPVNATAEAEESRHIKTNETVKLLPPIESLEVKWSSSDSYIASVDQYGNVTGHRKGGTAVITAETENESYSWEVVNSISMPEITARQYVDEIKVGMNFGSDYCYNTVAFWHDTENYNYTSVPVNVTLHTGSAKFLYQNLHKARLLRKGDEGHMSILFPSVVEDDGENGINDLLIGFGIPSIGSDSTEIIVEINNACIVAENGDSYPVEAFNGKHVIPINAGGEPDGYWVETPMTGGIEALETETFQFPDVQVFKNAVLSMDIHLIEAPLPDEEHWKYVLGIPNNLKYFDEMKNAGYNAIKLGAHLDDYMNLDTGEIRKEWFIQTEKLIGYITSLDMYCVLTFGNDFSAWKEGGEWVGDHFALDWLTDEYKPFIDKRWADIWRQVAEYFKDYDDHLMFLSACEPGMYYDIPGMTFEEIVDISVERLNELNDIFVKTVRKSGGNNDKRFLSIAGFQTILNGNWGIDDLTIPNDDRLTLSMHLYPDGGAGAIHSWSSDNEEDTGFSDSIFDFIEEFQRRNKVPVIMDEWGSSKILDTESRIDLTEYMISNARALGVPCFNWEDNFATGGFDERYIYSLHYDMQNKKWVEDEIQEAMMNAVYGTEER